MRVGLALSSCGGSLAASLRASAAPPPAAAKDAYKDPAIVSTNMKPEQQGEAKDGKERSGDKDKDKDKAVGVQQVPPWIAPSIHESANRSWRSVIVVLISLVGYARTDFTHRRRLDGS